MAYLSSKRIRVCAVIATITPLLAACEIATTSAESSAPVAANAPVLRALARGWQVPATGRAGRPAVANRSRYHVLRAIDAPAVGGTNILHASDLPAPVGQESAMAGDPHRVSDATIETAEIRTSALRK